MNGRHERSDRNADGAPSSAAAVRENFSRELRWKIRKNVRNRATGKTWKKRNYCKSYRKRTDVRERGGGNSLRSAFVYVPCRSMTYRYAEIFKSVAGRKRGAFQEVAGARPVLASLRSHGRYAIKRKQT